MSVESRLAAVEESLRLLRDADRLQGRRVSAAAPTDQYYLAWNATSKKWEPKGFAHAVKLASQNLNDTTLEDIDDLLFPIGANERWMFEFFIIWRAHEDGDIKFTITVPSGAAGDWALGKQTGTSSAGPSYEGNVAFGSAIDIQADASNQKRGTHIFGAVLNGATPGDVQLQAAQNDSSGTDSVVFAHSWLRAHQL